MRNHSASSTLPHLSISGNGVWSRVLAGCAATLVVAAAARVAFPLPFTPVPFTLQPLAVLLVGLLLGPVDGALAMTAYLLEGLAGLPVFSPAGPGGILQLLGPTGGYLLAYPAVAFLSGWIARRWASKAGDYGAALVACCLAVAVLFVAGAGWLTHVSGMHGRTLWIAAVGPFLPGEIVKAVIAAGVYRTCSPWTQR